jgi:cryptochrome 1
MAMNGYSSSGESCDEVVVGRGGGGLIPDISGVAFGLGTRAAGPGLEEGQARQEDQEDQERQERQERQARQDEEEQMEELASAGRAALVASQRGGDFGSGALGHPGPCKQYGRIIVWFRRDLRLTDNPALLAASLLAEEVVCVYVYAPEEDGQFQPGRCSRWWLKSALSSLRRELWERCETQLLFFRAPDSGRLLASLVEDMKADGVFFNHLYDPISMVRDNEVKTLLRRNEVVCQSFNCDTLREPWSVVDADSNAYASFESFWKAHQDEERLGRVAKPAPMVGRLCDGSGGGVGGLGKAAKSDAPAGVCLGLQSSLSLTGEWHCATLEDVGILSRQEAASNVQLEVHWKPGRADGMKMLQSFVDDKLGSFSYDKAKTDRKSTSRLSPYLHYGEIGIREVLAVVETWEASASQSGKKSHAHATAFRKQLGYREYARYLSFHFPFTHERAMLEHLRAIPWRYDQQLFKAWRTGNTGYPIVDAAMREIWSTGWMHNRCRVVCASFLVKYLLLPWQWGLKHFWDALLDADLECDALGWQYCAGCLTDGHEFSMVMDLELEVEKFDPKGMYVRRWIPSLARLPMEYVHCPWRAPPEVLEDAGIELGEDYPWPVVEFEAAKETVSKVADLLGQQTSKSEAAGKDANAGIAYGSHAGNDGQEAVKDTLKSPYKPATTPIDGATSIEDLVGAVSTDSFYQREINATASPSTGSIAADAVREKSGAPSTGATSAVRAGRADRKRTKT